MIRILATTFAGLLGLAFGSFLNVCLSRWPAGESVVQPHSHCRNCAHVLAWWENLPVLSWILLRGRCRKCKSGISWRYPLVEAAVGALWAFSAWSFIPRLPPPELYGTDIALIVLVFCDGIGQMILGWFLVALAVLDAENLWLPDFLTLPGIALGLVLLLVRSACESYLAWGAIHWGPGMLKELLVAIFSGFFAAALILLIRWLYKLIRHREGVGVGDAKLMALLAAWLGLPGALLAFALGAVLGASAALALLAIPRKPQADIPTWASTKLPLGTFLCVGGIISALWGQSIIRAYLRWAGL
jgi:leader peptidase (prepilin peptidase)/N-methyltransferase